MFNSLPLYSLYLCCNSSAIEISSERGKPGEIFFREAPGSTLLIGVRADLAVITVLMIKRMQELISRSRARMLFDTMAPWPFSSLPRFVAAVL